MRRSCEKDKERERERKTKRERKRLRTNKNLLLVFTLPRVQSIKVHKYIWQSIFFTNALHPTEKTDAFGANLKVVLSARFQLRVGEGEVQTHGGRRVTSRAANLAVAAQKIVHFWMIAWRLEREKNETEKSKLEKLFTADEFERVWTGEQCDQMIRLLFQNLAV